MRIGGGPLLSVDVVGCRRVRDVKTRVSSLFPGLGAETMTFIAQGCALRDSDELDRVGIGAREVVTVHWPAYIARFHGHVLPCRACIADKIEAAVSSEDHSELRRVLKDASEQGHLSGKGQYGLFLIKHGAGGEDLREGIAHLKSAADCGDLESMFEYGRFLLEGVGNEEAVEECRLSRGVMYVQGAADRGHAGAQFLYGKCLLNGRGIDRDCASAFEYFRLASEQGHVGSLVECGICLRDGLGVDY